MDKALRQEMIATLEGMTQYREHNWPFQAGAAAAHARLALQSAGHISRFGEPLFHGNHITLSGSAYLAELKRGPVRTWVFEHWFSATAAGSRILAPIAQWWIAFVK